MIAKKKKLTLNYKADFIKGSLQLDEGTVTKDIEPILTYSLDFEK